MPDTRSSAATLLPTQQAYLGALLDTCAAHGLAATALRAAVYQRAATPDLTDWCAEACTRLDVPTLGAEFGARLDLTSHGVLGHALLASPTVGEALRRLLRYVGLSAPHISLEQVLDGPRVLLTCTPHAGLEPRGFYVDAVLTSILVSARTLFGPRVAQEGQLWRRGPAPAHAAQVQHLAGVPVHFRQPEDAAVMPRRYLDAPLSSADPVLEELSRAQCEALLVGMRRQRGLADRVRQRLLATRGGLPDAPAVARDLGMAERTLRRRLAAEGSSWRSLLDEVRQQLAQRYLLDTALPVADVAHLVGYSDTANFRRAFVRLHGEAPGPWRARQRAAADAQQGTAG